MEAEYIYANGYPIGIITKQDEADPAKHFNFVDRCPSCGEPRGRLKGCTPPTFNQHRMYTQDKVLYHIHPIMQKATIKCPNSSLMKKNLSLSIAS